MPSEVPDIDSSLSSDLSRLRSGAALAALDDLAVLVARGEDRSSFLQGMLSQEVSGLAVGDAQRALLLTEQGRVVSDLRLLILPDEIWLETPAKARAEVRAALERFIVADDVDLVDGTQVGLALRGPEAARVMAAAGEASAGPELACNQSRAERLAGVEGHLLRLREFGVDAFHFWTDEQGRDRVIELLAGAGAQTVSAAALEVQRLSAGVGALGADYGLDTLAPEVPSLEEAISYRKGCYLGQEVVERVAARGQVKWKVIGLRVSGVVAAGDPVQGESGEVGRITSSAAHLEDGRSWAMARIRASHAAAGAPLVVVHGDRDLSAEVSAESGTEGSSDSTQGAGS